MSQGSYVKIRLSRLLEAPTGSAADVLSGYRVRWPVELVWKNMQPRLQRNQRRRKHATGVAATGRALLMAWALHEGITTVLRTL
jgi:hypothetical protein